MLSVLLVMLVYGYGCYVVVRLRYQARLCQLVSAAATQFLCHRSVCLSFLMASQLSAFIVNIHICQSFGVSTNLCLETE